MANNGKQTLTQRIALDGGDEIKRELLALGKAGETAFKQLEAQARATKAATSGFNGDLVKLRASFTKLGAAAKKVGQNFSFLGGTVGQLGTVLATVFSADVLINTTSAWTDMTSRIRQAVGAGEDANAIMLRISETAKGTYTSLEQTAQQFADNAYILNALGVSTKTQLDLQESLNNVLVVSGARGERLEQVQRSFSNALQLGALRGEDFNNFAKAGSRFMELLADKLQVNVTALKGMAAQGLITRDVLIEVLLEAQTKVREEAERMPMTIRDAFQNLNTAFMTFIGTADQASGASARIAEAIQWVGENLGLIIPALLSLVGIFLLIKAVNLAKDFYDLARVLVKDVLPSIVKVTLALARNPFGLAAIIITSLILVIIQATGGFENFGRVVQEVSKIVIDAITPLVEPLLAFVKATGEGIAAFLRWAGLVKGDSEDAADSVGQVEGAVDDTSTSLATAGETGTEATNAISTGFDKTGTYVTGAMLGVDQFTESLAEATEQAKALVAQVSKLNASSGESTSDLVPTYAGGGSVRGPGTGRSDSILARLSNGEFVMRAKAVKKWGLAALNRMNAGIPAFATGGLVTNFGASVPAFAGAAPANGGRPFTLVLDGQSFSGLSASDEVAESLVRFASSRKVRRAGKRPSWGSK